MMIIGNTKILYKIHCKERIKVLETIIIEKEHQKSYREVCLKKGHHSELIPTAIPYIPYKNVRI